MELISYAQNFEDIMLWRALQHIKKGFYIDVGAWFPDHDSVTKLFYEKGWHGINIEPNPLCHAQLKLERPKDLNLCVALSNQAGYQDMSFVNETGLSTLDHTIASSHKKSGFSVERKKVDVITLGMLFKKYISRNQEIHFLKIDVEGYEKEVIESHNWNDYLPWVVVVEAISPLTRENTYQYWENILLSAGYSFVYSDALNRFYISKEHSELKTAFKYPPNVFDEFTLKSQVDEYLLRQRTQLIQAEAHISSLLNSTSWKITAPMRIMKNSLKTILQKLKKEKCS